MTIPQKLPWFAFYPSDFLSSTIDMSPAVVGAYIRLLSHQWLNGVIPRDEGVRGRVTGGLTPQGWELIKSRLIEIEEGYVHPRLMMERNKSSEIFEKRQKRMMAVNDNRYGHRDDGRVDDRGTTTTTTTTTYQPPTEEDFERIKKREKKQLPDLIALIELQKTGTFKRCSAIGCGAETTELLWNKAMCNWAKKGQRPLDFVTKFCEKLTGSRNVDSVIKFRIKSS